jgi:hypothetical protein
MLGFLVESGLGSTSQQCGWLPDMSETFDNSPENRIRLLRERSLQLIAEALKLERRALKIEQKELNRE